MSKRIFDLAAWAIALLCAGVAAGMFLLDFFVTCPVLARLDAQTAIETYQASLPIRRTVFQVATVSAVLSASLLCVYFSAGASRRLLVASVLCFVALVIYTNASLIPLTREIAAWRPASPPAGWEDIFLKMIVRENLRGFFPAVAFVLELIAFTARKTEVQNPLIPLRRDTTGHRPDSRPTQH